MFDLKRNRLFTSNSLFDFPSPGALGSREVCFYWLCDIVGLLFLDYLINSRNAINQGLSFVRNYCVSRYSASCYSKTSKLERAGKDHEMFCKT